jgi:hypothetical protein
MKNFACCSPPWCLSSPTQLAPNYHRLQPPANSPKVVFIGDYITYEWASAFAANPPELSAWMRPCKSPRRRAQTVCRP